MTIIVNSKIHMYIMHICHCFYSIEGVTVNTSEFSTGRLCTNFDLINSPLYNDGRGVFIEDGRADVEFCSDNGFSVSDPACKV